MSLANILLSVALVVGAPSFVYFFRLMKQEPDESALLVKSRPGKLVNLIVTVPIICALVFGAFSLRIVAAACLFPAILFLALFQRQWLLRHGAKPAFLNRLLISSVGFGLAIALFAGAMVLGA